MKPPTPAAPIPADNKTYVKPKEPKPTPEELPYLYQFTEVCAKSISDLEEKLGEPIQNPENFDRSKRLTMGQWDQLWVANIGKSKMQWEAAEAEKSAPVPVKPTPPVKRPVPVYDDLDEEFEEESDEDNEDIEELEGGVGVVRKRE